MESLRPSAPGMRSRTVSRFRTVCRRTEKLPPVLADGWYAAGGQPNNDDELNRLGDRSANRILNAVQAANSDRDAERARDELKLSMLMDRHGTSRVLFRNTRNGVGGLGRQTHARSKTLPTQYQTAFKVCGIMGVKRGRSWRRDGYSIELFIRSSKAIPARVERLTRLRYYEWLMGYLTSHRSQKVLVICAKATALQLEQVLRGTKFTSAPPCSMRAYRLLNATAHTAAGSPEDTGAQVLLCSRNRLRRAITSLRQQSGDDFGCRLTDLAGTQRIGRLDRIGGRA